MERLKSNEDGEVWEEGTKRRKRKGRKGKEHKDGEERRIKGKNR